MSYCRWSTNCHECDLYVYKGCDDLFHIHVAGRRFVSDKLRPNMEDFCGLGRLLDYWRACDEWIKNTTLEDIGLKHDGESFSAESAEGAAAIVAYLGECGYHYPKWLEQDLISEQDA